MPATLDASHPAHSMPASTDSIIPDLARFGPQSLGPIPSPQQARAYVASLAGSHYENFSVLSRLVPERLRPDFAAVYAFCRWSDDLGDETGVGEAARARSSELLAWWRTQLEVCFSFARSGVGEPPRNPVFIALAETVRRHSLSAEPFHHLIDAFEQDQRVTKYDNWAQLIDYCTRSANPVGRIVLALGGVRGGTPHDDRLIEMSDATCTALQLTNFWQDVRRDLFERDRIYLPLAETSLTAEALKEWAGRPLDPAARVPFIRAVRPLVERTRELFIRGRPLPGSLAGDLSPVIWLFGRGGESVLSAVERIGCSTLWERPRLTAYRKASLLAMAGILRVVGRWRQSSRPGAPQSL